MTTRAQQFDPSLVTDLHASTREHRNASANRADGAEGGNHERAEHKSKEAAGDQVPNRRTRCSVTHSAKITFVPGRTIEASFSASQLVSRTQPCDVVFPIVEGSGVPCSP